MGIRLETHWDQEAIRRLLKKAFGRSAEADLVDALRDSDGYEPRLSLVADQHNVVIGYILFTRITLESDPPVPVLGLAPVAVTPAFQNRGVGSALIREGLARADAMGEPLVVVLGHADYYPRFGFVRASTLEIYPPNPDIPDEVFMVKPLSSYRDDLKGTIIYPDTFDSVSD